MADVSFLFLYSAKPISEMERLLCSPVPSSLTGAESSLCSAYCPYILMQSRGIKKDG